MESDALVRLCAVFGLSDALDRIERRKSRILLQLSAFKDQHLDSGPEELASDCQACRTASNYDKVRLNYGICTDSAEILDSQIQSPRVQLRLIKN